MRKPNIKQLPVSSLTVDRTVQRSVDPLRAKTIAEELIPAALGLITVSHRADGTYHVVDGQHRVVALRLAATDPAVKATRRANATRDDRPFVELGEDPTVQARVFDDLSIQDEAQLFRLLNNTRMPSLMDRFHVRVVEGEETATAVSDIVSHLGWTIRMGGFAAVAAAERLYNKSPGALKFAVEAATRAWGYDPSSVDGRILEGLGHMYLRYGGSVDLDRLCMQLSKFPGGARGYLGQVRGIKQNLHLTLVNASAYQAVELYNKQLKSNRLPRWLQG